MKFVAAVISALAALALTGCEHRMTLEEARAACTKQGGFLVVIHSQKVTMAGVGQEIDSPGDCVSASKFDPGKPATAVPAPNGSPSP